MTTLKTQERSHRVSLILKMMKEFRSVCFIRILMSNDLLETFIRDLSSLGDYYRTIRCRNGK